MKTIAFGLLIAAAMFASPASAKNFCLDNGNKAVYGPGGSYKFITSAGVWHGHWSGNPNVGGSVQVNFPNGFERNDRFRENGGVPMLIERGGASYSGRFC